MNIICKNDREFVTLLQKATGYLSGQETVEPDKQSQIRVKKLLQAFYNEPEIIRNKKLQAVATSGDFPQVLADAFNVIIQNQNFDLKWQQAFQLVTLGENQDFWEIEDVANSITFRKMEEGQRLETSGMSAERTLAYVDYYGGALGWTDKMIRFRKIPNIINRAILFRNKQNVAKANIHYALLVAAVAAAQITAYQGAAALGQLQRDILTINAATVALVNRNLNKGYYADMASAPILIYANYADEPRIEAVFRARTADFAAAGLQGAEVFRSRPFQRLYTANSNITAGSPLFVLPGGKLQRAQAMAPTTYRAPQDILTLNYVESVWEIYGAIVADSEQVQQATLG